MVGDRGWRKVGVVAAFLAPSLLVLLGFWIGPMLGTIWVSPQDWNLIDEEVWQWPQQYLLGDDLLVAPVTSPGAETWRTYLPAGEWEDYFTGSPHTGPTVVERAVPLDEIPVFRRL
jgi:ABC-type sugar transport system permease subunit